mmetsp:Transcript_32388/g.74151  ORF Transcript_32388/g.74151 Transcript_32388/m.74151 type:complete len:213 (-) Transcript_32388:122-760(-)
MSSPSAAGTVSCSGAAGRCSVAGANMSKSSVFGDAAAGAVWEGASMSKSSEPESTAALAADSTNSNSSEEPVLVGCAGSSTGATTRDEAGKGSAHSSATASLLSTAASQPEEPKLLKASGAGAETGAASATANSMVAAATAASVRAIGGACAAASVAATTGVAKVRALTRSAASYAICFAMPRRPLVLCRSRRSSSYSVRASWAEVLATACA